MKPLSIVGYSLIISNFILFTSCNKETVAPNSSNSAAIHPTAGTVSSTLNLVAYNWQDNKDGSYSSELNGILNGSSVDAVYTIWGGIRYSILNETPFLGGYLKATVQNSGLKITYRFDGASLPFNQLPIIVMVTK